MRRKVIATMSVCFVALMTIAGAGYFMSEDNSKGEVRLTKIKEATTYGDRISDVEEGASSFTGNVAHISGNKADKQEVKQAKNDVKSEKETVTEREKESETTTERPTRETIAENPIKDENGNGLSTEANAMIEKLDFTKNSQMMWPVEGNVVLEYNMDNTIYFPTLDQYKTNPAIVIQSEEYAPVVAVAKGVVTKIDESPELGVYLTMALGNDYEVTYGQIINPIVEVGQTVEAGETIASVNEPTKFYKKEGYNLNFAVTKKGKPVDPMKYMIVNE